jgi:MbtH protein
MPDDGSDNATYIVVCNDEDQYSIWEADRGLPAGWSADGFRGPREACLGHINEVWTDMRPRSLRIAMDGARDNPMDDATDDA